MIKVEHLVFDYPGVRALNDISFNLSLGSVTALVGPNGAGKTTLMRCLAALEELVAGKIEINGIDVLSDPRNCHRQMGYLSDFFGLYDQLTIRRSLLHAASIHDIQEEWLEKSAAEAAGRLGIADRMETVAGKLSRGLRQRLAIAQAIVHNPRVLLLDEPASGLDPEARHSLAGLFLKLRDEGMTILVSSHILGELEEYSSDMLVIREGRIISHEPVGAASLKEARVRIRCSLARPAGDLYSIVGKMEEIGDLFVGDPLHFDFTCAEDHETQHNLLRKMMDSGLTVSGFAPERRKLQDAYLATVGNSGKKEASS
jgi:ABC-2 type transport system ATP-binding protein